MFVVRLSAHKHVVVVNHFEMLLAAIEHVAAAAAAAAAARAAMLDSARLLSIEGLCIGNYT